MVSCFTFLAPLGLTLSSAMGFTNAGALESKEDDIPIKFVERPYDDDSSPESKRMSTFKPEESTHL